ncbi:lyase family protein [Psychrobacter lutiphocae]|uniref:lyase family protein n=1 Tax=Psychrobacter lutiphocae TaxID=540500 RepID=UPI00036FAA41|nr:lyase family protein [Psychrobacter lutiphocae]
MKISTLINQPFLNSQLTATLSDEHFVTAMLNFELAILAVREHHSLIPQGILEKSKKHLLINNFDLESIAQATHLGGNPAIPFVAQAKQLLPDNLKPYFHQTVTSQDVVDTAMMMVIKTGLTTVNKDLIAILNGLSLLVIKHRHTPMIGRTLLQHALPITFGVKVAQWASALMFAIDNLIKLQQSGLFLQWGGPVGMSSIENESLHIPQKVAQLLGLSYPILPWHTNRQPIHNIGATLDALASALEKIATDVALMAQSELGEVSEPLIEGMGGSSSMPHKRNPVLCALIKAAAIRMHGHLTVISNTTAQPFERSLGEWHASWMPLMEGLALVAGATGNMKVLIEGLQVYPSRMADNLDLNSDAYLIAPLKQFFENETEIIKAIDIASEQAHRNHTGFVKTFLACIEQMGLGIDTNSSAVSTILDPLSYSQTAISQCEIAQRAVQDMIESLSEL